MLRKTRIYLLCDLEIATRVQISPFEFKIGEKIKTQNIYRLLCGTQHKRCGPIYNITEFPVTRILTSVPIDVCLNMQTIWFMNFQYQYMLHFAVNYPVRV